MLAWKRVENDRQSTNGDHSAEGNECREEGDGIQPDTPEIGRSQPWKEGSTAYKQRRAQQEGVRKGGRPAPLKALEEDQCGWGQKAVETRGVRGSQIMWGLVRHRKDHVLHINNFFTVRPAGQEGLRIPLFSSSIT